jgi:hypothetical protein
MNGNAQSTMIAVRCSHPVVVVRKPMAADVETVGLGNDDDEEAPFYQARLRL